jgi:hypothetical protein
LAAGYDQRNEDSMEADDVEEEDEEEDVGEMRDSGSVKTEYVDAEDQQGEYSNDAENVSS